VKVGVTSFRALAGAGPVPADAVTTSASGLDPDVSPANAFAQVPAVARARGLNEAQVRDLVVRAVRKPALGFLSEPRVNVLLLNLALDQLRSS
jgi:K+-transporting ATPase ATPase C chain